jgi:hypothetical protein
MEQIQHLLGLCPDSIVHTSILKLLFVGVNDVYYAFLYVKSFLK